uniref:F-box domain-containing protein n=1 Tax=Timema bartmani TaxID=61472 RepID=A0A7R9EN01_9NEOP|nr:unnamed protein product [Timema bartmani]
MENKLGEKAEAMAGGADEKGVEEGSNIPVGKIDEEMAKNLARKVDEETRNTSSKKTRLDVDMTNKLVDKVAKDMATMSVEKVDEEGANKPVEGFKDIAYSIRKTFYGDESRNTGWDAPEEASGAFSLDIGDMLTAYDQHREDLVSQIANFTIDEWKGDNRKIMWKRRDRSGSSTSSAYLATDEGSDERFYCYKGPLKKNTVKENTFSNSDIDESLCFVNSLNDDCLMHIFSFLSKIECLGIERVCKRWQSASIMSWSGMKTLDMSDFVNDPYVLPTDDVVYRILQRCGALIHTVDISLKPNCLTPKYRAAPKEKRMICTSALCSISSWNCSFNMHLERRVMSQYVLDACYPLPLSPSHCSRALRTRGTECPQLCHLNLSGVPVTSKDLGILGKNLGKQLLTLTMESCPGASDRDIGRLFQNCTKLEKVNVSRTKNLYGHCLEKLCENPVLELAINDCNNIQANVLIPSLQRLPKLSSLQMSCCINMTNKDVAMIVEAVPQLKELSMSRFFPFIDSMALTSLHLLSNLVSLDVHLNPVINDDVMAKIACSCIKIKHLNITGCSINSSDEPSLSNTGVIAALKLPNLESLYMSYLARVTDEVLEVAANHTKLKHLECRGVSSFTDLGCSRVVTLCSQLESFDFSGCDFVTDKTVIAAMSAVKQRMNNVTLLLTVGGTCVTENTAYKDVPLLQVSHLNLCVPHLRPDFVDDIFFPQSDDDFFDDNDDLDEFHLLDWDQGAQGYEFCSVEDYFDYEDYDDYELYEEYDDDD